MKRTPLIALTLLVPLLGACRASIDEHVFKSTVFQPLSVELHDQVAKELLWRYDVPVEHKLRVTLRRKSDQVPFQMSALPATNLKWILTQIEDDEILLRGEKQLEGRPVILRLIKRPAPELPDDRARPGEATLASNIASRSAVVEQADAAPDAPGPVVLKMDAAGVVTVGARTVDAATIRELFIALVKESPDRAVVVEAAADTPTAKVNELAALADETGVKKFEVRAPEVPQAQPNDPSVAPEPLETPEPPADPDRPAAPAVQPQAPSGKEPAATDDALDVLE